MLASSALGGWEIGQIHSCPPKPTVPDVCRMPAASPATQTISNGFHQGPETGGEGARVGMLSQAELFNQDALRSWTEKL